MMLPLLLLACALGDDPVVTGTVTTAVRIRPSTISGIKGDPKCDCLHASTPKTENLVVGEGGGLKWALVRITKGLEGKSFTPPQEPVVLDQRGCVYAPHVVGVMVGQPVEFRNSDDMLHNVHGIPFDNKEFNLAQLKGAADRRTFPKPEIFKVICNVHPWMGAHVGVFEHPYFAVTDAEGRFTIKGLPPGKYSLEVWHETLKASSAEITVAGKETRVPPIELVAKP